MSAATARKILPPLFNQWGRTRTTEGDLIHAQGYHKLRQDGRNASFVRVQHIFRLRLPPKVPSNPGNKSRTLLLALIQEAKTKVQSTYDYEVVSYSGELSKGEIVDVATIQCVVGRILDRKEWWIIDCTENLYPEFV
ncbi:hypothetical protein FRC10_011974 [Ceratobasidium sp. 414]|nr:hypothetical protein FRC10_011974 [Ceratobasidium sp. 414]